jgi:hypothetical protein
LGIALIYLLAGGMPHMVGKKFMKDKTYFETSPQLEVYTKIYGLPQLWESQFQEFSELLIWES